MRVLLLGGTLEATRMARVLADAAIPAEFSYAGRTERPVVQPLPTRIGGFGGAEGLATHIRKAAVTHVIDATHPFAAQMSANAIAACADTGTRLIALERRAWAAGPGDEWTTVRDVRSACAALPAEPSRVFLAIGRQNVGDFAPRPQHHYLLRLVDRPDGPLPLPDTAVIVARGPFGVAEDARLMRDHRIRIVVAKNAGGDGARAKIDAARLLGLPVVMIGRPAIPGRRRAETTDEVMRWLHSEDLGV